MAIVTDRSIFSLAWDAREDTQQLLLTTHWRWETDTPGAEVDYGAFATAVETWCNGADSFNEIVSTVYSVDVGNITPILQRISPLRLNPRVLSNTFPSGIVATTIDMPPNIAHALTMRADYAGPRFRGTKHIGGVPSGFTSNGKITTAGQTAIGELGLLFSQSFGLTVSSVSGFMRPVILHRAEPAVSPDIIDFTVGLATRTMRSRTVGHGP